LDSLSKAFFIESLLLVLQAATGFVFVEKINGGFFDMQGEGVEVVIGFEEGFGCAEKDVGARVSHTVDGVAKSHEAFSCVEFGAQVGF
jgi:hypothetical protein